MKRTIKITRKYLAKLGLDLDPAEFVGGEIKRYNYSSDPDEILEVDEKGYSIGKIMTIDVDSDGDVMLPSGVDIGRYGKNPVVLFNHKHDYPVGYSDKMSITPEDILSKTIYGTTTEAQKIQQLVRDKVLRTHSMGFITLEVAKKGSRAFNALVSQLRQTYPAKFPQEKVDKILRIITKAILVEYSIVTIPANEDTVMLEVKAFAETINKALDRPSLGCVSAVLPADLAGKVRGFAGMIPDDAVHTGVGTGRVADPHITVKFGLHTDNHNDVVELLDTEKPIEVTLQKTTVFENDDAIVLKIDVGGSDLHRLHRIITDKMEATDAHPDYKPHVTVAYLKVGTEYDKYLIDLFDGTKVAINQLQYESPDGETSMVSLNGPHEEPKAAPVEIKVLQRATTIKMISTQEERETKALQNVYRLAWGC